MRPRTDDEILEDLKDWPVRNIYVERGAKLIEQLRQRVAELEKERDEALRVTFDPAVLEEMNKLTAERDQMNIYCAQAERLAGEAAEERDALKQQRDKLVEAATMAVEMIEYNKHERRHVRWKLNDAIAAVRGAAEIGKEIGE